MSFMERELTFCVQFMSLENTFWRCLMARKKTKGAIAPTYSLPAFELVPVQEDAISGNERRQFVTELLARMYCLVRARVSQFEGLI